MNEQKKDYWTSIAMDACDGGHPVLPLIVSCLLGLGTLYFSRLIVPSICVTGFASTQVLTKSRKQGAQFDAVTSGELSSIPLNAMQLRRYIADVGVDEVMVEINMAIEMDLLISDACQELLDKSGDAAVVSQSQSVDVNVAEHPQSVERTVIQPQNSGLAKHPRSVATVISGGNPRSAEVYIPESQKPWSLEDMVTETDNRLILGLKGSGKTVVVSKMIEIVRARFPDKRVFAIDPKADPNELDLYNLATEVHRGNIGEMSPADALKFIEDGYNLYINHPEPGLLIIDECIMVGGAMTDNKSNYLESKLRYIVAGGDSRGLNVWLIAQSPMLTDLGLKTGVATQLNKTIVATAESLPNIRVWGKNGSLMAGVDIEAAIPCIKASPIPKGRAIYYCGWHPMPIIETQYNRDERRVNAVALAEENSENGQNAGVNAAAAPTQWVSATATATSVNADVPPPPPALTRESLTALVLEYFAAADKLTPKSIKNIRDGSRVRDSKATVEQVAAVLGDLLQSKDLTLTDGGYVSPLWQSEDDHGD